MATWSKCLCIAVVAWALGGCIAIGGSKRVVSPTVGQQLIDLQSARDRGAISTEEFEQAKHDILRGRLVTARAD